MGLPKKLAIALASVVGFLAIVVIGAYWWASVPPKRPKSVPPTAAYYPGLALPFQAHKHGEWVNCWFDPKQGVDWCRVTFVDGRLLYEGVFFSYQRHVAVPQGELLIDPEVMSNAQEQVEVDASSQESSSPGLQVVPLVYLRNGEVLIPEKEYGVGKKRIDDLREARKP